MRKHKKTGRGFTIIELMIVVLIMGLLSSVALPELRQLIYRAKQSERSVVMGNLSTAINELGDHFPTPLAGGGSTLLADWNPPLPASGIKKTFDPTQPGWKSLSWQPDGTLYFNYYALGVQLPGSGIYTICAQADLDGNGNANSCCRQFTSSPGGIWTPTSDTCDTAPDY